MAEDRTDAGTDRPDGSWQDQRPPGGDGRDPYPPQPGYDRSGYGQQPGPGPQSGYPQSGYPQSGYPQSGSPQAGYGQRPAVPPTNAGWAVAASLLFFPLAFSAWNAALDVTRLWVMDDFLGAQAASDKAKRYGKIALGIGLTIYGLYFVVIIAFVALGIALAPTSTR